LSSLLVERNDKYNNQTVNEENGEQSIIIFVSAVIGLLLIASLVGIVTNRLRLPYTVGLVLIGLVLSIRGQEDFNVPPEIFLSLLVPPLVFEAAFRINIRDLFRDITPILILAIPGLLITTFLVGGVVSLGTGFPLVLSLIFGALIAATDPVAVVALFRSLGVPKRLQVLLEGESLLNDGTAIVVFNLMVGIAATGTFELLESAIDFFVIAGGGLAIGFILGVIISQAIRYIDDPLIETTLTTVLAFGSYLVAEQFHVSGVLAVVAAGLLNGNIGPQGMSPSSRILLNNFWDYAAFLANSVVFLLIGLQINLAVLFSNWQVIVWAILAVLVTRAVSIYGLSWIGKGIPLGYKNVLYWGGLRGAISLALALSLPNTLGPAREEIQAMAFGVVLFTLLVQGLSMKPLINRMHLSQRSEVREEYERRHARSLMARVSYQRLQEMYRNGLISAHVWEIMSEPIKQHTEALANTVSEALSENPGMEGEIIETTMREMLLSQRSALFRLLREGIISEDTFASLVVEVDTALAAPQTGQIRMLLNRQKIPITELMAVIVQESDVEKITDALNQLGNSVTRLSSFGGFLGRKNTTLMVGIPEGQEEQIIEAIEANSSQRIEVVPSSTVITDQENLITVQGATFFKFDVDRFEEL
jgi:CPA1 family monovalent cation:H+ antiporter